MGTRADVRTALAALLQAALVGPGLPAQAVCAYPPARPGGASPLVYLESAGTARHALSSAGSTATYYVNLVVLVLHTDGAAWDADDAEAALDAIEGLIAGAIEANPVAAAWQGLAYAGRSAVDVAAIGGAPYRRERIPLAVQVVT